MKHSCTSVRRQIRVDWPDIVRDSGVDLAALDFLPAVPKLLGSSTKVQLGEKIGVLTAVSYMAPADESGQDMCTIYATSACKSLCLGHNSGRLAMTPSRRARLWKTALYHGDRGLFCVLMSLEADVLAHKAATLGLKAAIRPDGSSDCGIGNEIALSRPELQVYDYTKDAGRARMVLAHGPANYDVTLSYNGENREICENFLSRGGRVAVVFGTQKGFQLPRNCWGFPVVDGDQHDATFLHPRGVILGLRLKAAANRHAMRKIGVAGGFVVLAS